MACSCMGAFFFSILPTGNGSWPMLQPALCLGIMLVKAWGKNVPGEMLVIKQHGPQQESAQMPALLLQCVPVEMGYGYTSVNKANWRLALITTETPPPARIPGQAAPRHQTAAWMVSTWPSLPIFNPKDTVCVALQPMRQRGWFQSNGNFNMCLSQAECISSNKHLCVAKIVFRLLGQLSTRDDPWDTTFCLEEPLWVSMRQLASKTQ